MEISEESLTSFSKVVLDRSGIYCATSCTDKTLVSIIIIIMTIIIINNGPSLLVGYKMLQTTKNK